MLQHWFRSGGRILSVEDGRFSRKRISSGAALSLHIEACNFCLFTDGVYVVKENVYRVQSSGTVLEAWQS